MSRRDPERIYLARRAGIFARLRDAERVNVLDAEHWISRWGGEAGASGRARDIHYWSNVWDRIAREPTSTLGAISTRDCRRTARRAERGLASRIDSDPTLAPNE
jgi:hypothetical protein